MTFKTARTAEERLAMRNVGNEPFISTLGEWKNFLLTETNHPLSALDLEAIAQFTNGLKFKEGLLVHAEYSMIEHNLSNSEFMNLWAMFGISPELFQQYRDQVCFGPRCTRGSDWCGPDC